MAAVLPEISQMELDSNGIPIAPSLPALDSNEIPPPPPLPLDASGIPIPPALNDPNSATVPPIPSSRALPLGTQGKKLETKFTEEIIEISNNSKDLSLSLKTTLESLTNQKSKLEKEMIDLNEKRAENKRNIEFFTGKNKQLENQLEKVRENIRDSVSKEKHKERYKEFYSESIEAEKKIKEELESNTNARPRIEAQLEVIEKSRADLQIQIDNVKTQINVYRRAYNNVTRGLPPIPDPAKNTKLPAKPAPQKKKEPTEQKEQQEAVITEETVINYLDAYQYAYDEDGDYNSLVFRMLKRGLLAHPAIAQSKTSKITSQEMEDLEDSAFVSRIKIPMLQSNISEKTLLDDISKIICFDIRLAISSRKKQPFNNEKAENWKLSYYILDDTGEPMSASENRPLEILKNNYFKTPNMSNEKFSELMQHHLLSGKIIEKRINEIVSNHLKKPYSISAAIALSKQKAKLLAEEKAKRLAEENAKRLAEENAKRPMPTSPSWRPRPGSRTSGNKGNIAEDQAIIQQVREELEERIRRAREDAETQKKHREESEKKEKEERRRRQEAEAQMRVAEANAAEEKRLRELAEQQRVCEQQNGGAGGQPQTNSNSTRRKGLANRSKK